MKDFGPNETLTDGDIDSLVWKFLKSDYVSDQYTNWPLDRRLEGFLQHIRLGHVADNGDQFNIILDRVMVFAGYQANHRRDVDRTPGARY